MNSKRTAVDHTSIWPATMCIPVYWSPDNVNRLIIMVQGQARSQYLGMGLFHCVKAVSFLNNDCKLVCARLFIYFIIIKKRISCRTSKDASTGCLTKEGLKDIQRGNSNTACSLADHACAQIHGNVCMAAIVVTEQLDWRLHGFDLLSEHAGGPDLPLINASWMVAQQYKPGEVGADG